MSEKLMPQPDNTVEKPETNIETAQQEVISELQSELEQFRDTPFQVYNSTPAQKSEFASIKGYPEYYTFLKEIDYLCQFALLKKADCIIFFDKSARGHGLLANKVLPIIALEKAIRENKSPSEIKIPLVAFSDVMKVETMTRENEENLLKYLRGLNAQSIVLFDESSMGFDPSYPTLINKDGSEPYRWTFTESDDPLVTERFNFSGTNYTSMSAVGQMTAFLRDKLPGKEINGYLGGSLVRGGLDRHSRTDTREIDTARDFNIKSTKFSKDIFTMRADADGADNETQNYRSQLRDEQSRMAWELFEQIILNEDPYHQS